MDLRTEASNRQQVAIILGMIIVALGLVYLLFLSGSGAAETPSPFDAPKASTEDQSSSQEATDVKEKTSKASKGLVETFEVFAARDPFMPLVPDAGKSSSGSNPDAGNSSGASGAAAGSQQSSGKTIDGHRVKLVDVFTKGGKKKVQVQVDSTVYTVDEGEVFADNFKVLSISGQCASMLFGDDQFTLCEGEEILK